MNIFVVNKDPSKAAQDLCDQHIVKMCLETAQILCTVAHDNGFEVPYKPTHRKHPCTVWAGEAIGNWNWLIAHGRAIGAEYTRRYGKKHKSSTVIEICGNLKIKLPTGKTPFAQAMDSQFKSFDPVIAYRAYYRTKKFARWRHSPKPSWV